ncbi:MAG TPA: type II toxin-antitoxin system PemK/MazF family toxin [Solirubrobacteraceae bacterium]
MIRRGEVWWADLGLPRGSEPVYRRPVMVASGDRYNASRLRTVTAVVMTRNTQLAALPGNVSVPASISGLPHDSVANVTQLATLDRDALLECVAHLPDWLVEQVSDGLRRALAL